MLERDGVLHEASGRVLARAVQHPDIHDFMEFVDPKKILAWTPTEPPGSYPKGYEPVFVHSDDQRSHYAHRFVYVSSRHVKCASFYAHPSKLGLKALRETITGGNLAVTIHDNGWALVSTNEAQILGGQWLAYVKADTIPLQPTAVQDDSG